MLEDLRSNQVHFSSRLEDSDISADETPGIPFELVSGEALAGPEYEEVTDKLFSQNSPLQIVLFASLATPEGVNDLIRGISKILAARDARFLVVDGSLSLVSLSGAEDVTAERELRRALGAVLAKNRTRAAVALERLRVDYDHILVNCGALGGSLDMSNLVAASDGIVLVVETGRTEKIQVARAIESVQEMQGRLIGFVMTRYRDPLPRWLRRLLS